MTGFHYTTYWRKNYKRLGLDREVCTMPHLQIVAVYYDGQAVVTTWVDEAAEGRLDSIRLWMPVDTLDWPAQKVSRENDERSGWG